MGNECPQLICRGEQIKESILQKNAGILISLKKSNQGNLTESFVSIFNLQKSHVTSFAQNFQEYKLDIALCQQKQEQTRSLSINIDKNISKFYEYSDVNSSVVVHLVQIGNFLNEQKSGDGITMMMINDTKKNQVMITIFAGKYVNGEETQGMNFSFKWENDKEEAFLFKGIKQNNQYKGFKFLLGEKSWDTFWGQFDENYLINAKGKHLYFSGQHYEFFQGNFTNGKKKQNQPGLIKMFDLKKRQGESNFLQELKTEKKEFFKAISQLKSLIYIQRSIDQEKICLQLIKVINIGAQLSPILNRYFLQNDKSGKILIEGIWKNDKIEGFTKELWPLVNYKFVGMYKDNQRHGYGQEYQDDILIARGFYKHNKMAIMKENQNLYKGYRYIDGKSSRKVD